MSIELTNAIFEDKLFTSTLTKVNGSPMGAKDAYWVNRIVKKIQEYGKEYIETKDKLIQQFSGTKKVMHMMSNKKNMANMMRQMKGMRGGGLPGGM